MARYTHIKEFVDFMGEDLRSSDILRPKGFSKGSKNCLHTPQGGVTQRPGSKFTTNGYGRFGITAFETTDLTGVSKSELIGFGAASAEESAVPWRLVKGTFTLTNNDVLNPATVSMVYVEATADFRFSITRSAASLCNIDLGTGTEAVPYSLADLDTAVSALTTFGMSAPTIGSTTPAAYMELLDAETVAAGGGTLTVDYWYWEEIYSTKPLYEFDSTYVDTGNDLIGVSLLGVVEINPFRNGDVVTYFGTSTAPTGLTNNTQYYIVGAKSGSVQLSLTLGGAAINLTGTGAGRMFLRGTRSNQVGFKHYVTEFPQTNYQNVSTVNLNGVLYSAAIQPEDSTELGKDGGMKSSHIAKYDGQRFYRTGFFNNTGSFFSSISSIAAGTVTDVKGSKARSAFTLDGQNYLSFLVQVDKAGNIVEQGKPTNSPGIVSTSSVVPKLTNAFPTFYSACGYNTAVAVTTSAAGPTLTYSVDNGFGGDQELKVGDIAYFWDERQDRFIQRLVTAATVTSITFDAKSLDPNPDSPNYDDGASPTLNDETAISANLRVAIYRNTDTDTTFKFVAEIPYSNVYADYYDDMPNADLGAEYVDPLISRDPPPPGSVILATYNNLLMMSADPTRARTVFYSDVDSPEYFQVGITEFDLPKPVNGMRQSGDVFLVGGKRDYIGVVTGDLTNFAFRVDQIANHIGFLSHDGVQQIDESTLFFPTHKGPYVLANGRDLVPLGAVKYPDGKTVSRIEPFFTRLYNATEEQPCFERCVATVIPKDSLYVLFVPFEDPSKPGFATSNSVTWVFDFGRGTWWPWYGLNMAGGATVLNDVVYWTSRIHDGQAGADNDNITCRLSQQQRLKGKYNYADHDQYIDYVFPMHWENLGDPGLFKRFLRARLFSHESRLAASIQVILKGYVDYSTANLSFTNTLTWASQLELKPKLKAEVCRSVMLELSSQRYYEPFPLSGLEIEAVANFRAEMKD